MLNYGAEFQRLKQVNEYLYKVRRQESKEHKIVLEHLKNKIEHIEKLLDNIQEKIVNWVNFFRAEVCAFIQERKYNFDTIQAELEQFKNAIPDYIDEYTDLIEPKEKLDAFIQASATDSFSNNCYQLEECIIIIEGNSAKDALDTLAYWKNLSNDRQDYFYNEYGRAAEFYNTLVELIRESGTHSHSNLSYEEAEAARQLLRQCLLPQQIPAYNSTACGSKLAYILWLKEYNNTDDETKKSILFSLAQKLADKFPEDLEWSFHIAAESKNAVRRFRM